MTTAIALAHIGTENALHDEREPEDDPEQVAEGDQKEQHPGSQRDASWLIPTSVYFQP